MGLKREKQNKTKNIVTLDSLGQLHRSCQGHQTGSLNSVWICKTNHQARPWGRLLRMLKDSCPPSSPLQGDRACATFSKQWIGTINHPRLTKSWLKDLRSLAHTMATICQMLRRPELGTEAKGYVQVS